MIMFLACTHVGCYANDGVGWGGMITFLALAHMLDATVQIHSARLRKFTRALNAAVTRP